MPNQHTITQIDPRLKEWATPKQVEYIDAVNLHHGMRAAARALGVNISQISTSISSVRAKAAAKGYSPEHDMTRSVPDPFVTKGVSTYYNKDGQVTGQWVKSRIDDQKWLEAQMSALRAMQAEIPRATPVPYKVKASIDELATVYTITDAHVGMLAWRVEAGEDWDLKIAEETLVGCFAAMIDAAPPAKVGFLNQLGDFLHQDGLQAVTPTSGHNLDSDGRFPKIIEVAIRVLRRVIGLMLNKHEQVIVGIFEGNHDIVSSIWLRELFKALYDREDRVRVMADVLPYSVFQHGKTMIAFHHGHLAKNAQLPLLMASQFPEVWGRTKKRYVHVGHRHHIDIKEHNGIVVHQHPTLAARDAYAARGGWVAERQVSAITYHKEFGQVRMDSVVPEMLDFTMPKS